MSLANDSKSYLAYNELVEKLRILYRNSGALTETFENAAMNACGLENQESKEPKVSMKEMDSIIGLYKSAKEFMSHECPLALDNLVVTVRVEVCGVSRSINFYKDNYGVSRISIKRKDA